MLTGQGEFPHRATQFQAAPKTIQQSLTIFAELLRGNVRVGSMSESGVVWPTTPKNRLQQDAPLRPVSCLVEIDK
jgi:hypothetical protein